jgi:polar amino acid transport system substrate-binding protein
MSRPLRLLAVSLVLLIAGTLAASVHAAGKLKIACNDFPPHKIEHPGPDGRLGFDVDIITEALRRAGWSIEVVYLPWKRALELAMRGDVDGLCSCSYVKEREEKLIFSDELGAVSVGLFARDAAALAGIDEVADLKGRKVAVVGGYNLAGELEAAGAQVQATSSDKNALDMLIGGNIDLLYGYELTTRHFMGTEAQNLVVDYREMHRNPYHFCITRAMAGAEQAMDAFNKGLAEMHADGSIARILDPYHVQFR